MKNSIKTFKFGGASLKDTAAVRNVAEILSNYKSQPLLIVVSAMGKTTNALEKVVGSHARQNGEATKYLEEVKQMHYKIIQDLFGPEDEIYALVNDTFVEIEWVLEEEPHPNYDYMYDQIVSVGGTCFF